MWDWHDGTAMWIMMVIFWLIVAVLVVYAIKVLSETRRDRSPSSRPTDQSRAMEILEERYARGEITLEEFDERRRVLTRPTDSG